MDRSRSDPAACVHAEPVNLRLTQRGDYHRSRKQNPSLVAKGIFALIVLTAIAVVWLGVIGIQKEPNGLPGGSQTFPAQAAETEVRPQSTP